MSHYSTYCVRKCMCSCDTQTVWLHHMPKLMSSTLFELYKFCSLVLICYSFHSLAKILIVNIISGGSSIHYTLILKLSNLKITMIIWLTENLTLTFNFCFENQITGCHSLVGMLSILPLTKSELNLSVKSVACEWVHCPQCTIVV